MSSKSHTNKNNWNDSLHIFFSPKLSLQGRKMFPQITTESTQAVYHRQPNFLTVLKKPLLNLYDKQTPVSTKKTQKNKYVQVVGENKNVEKRIQTTNNKKRCISPAVEEQLINNYQQSLNQAVNLYRSNPKKRMSQNKIMQHTHQRSEKRQGQEFYYFVGPGNNSKLIQQVLSRRFRWSQTNSSLFHFRWQQIRPKYHNNSITKQLYNHLPNHQIISDKGKLVNCLKTYCQKHNQQMFKLIPVCFQFDFGDLDRCQNQIKKFVEFFWDAYDRSSYKLTDQQATTSEQKSSKIDSPKKISKKQTIKQNKNFRTYRKQVVTVHASQNLRRKQQIKQLHKVLLSKLKPYHVFIDMANIRKQSKYISPVFMDIYGKTSLWLFKPSDLNRGRGIHLFRTIQQLGDLLKTQLSKHQKGSFIIQKYIQRPMLIDSRKFDIRVYGLVTQNQQYYFFQEGYIRTSSHKFDINSTNYYAHLTNNAIQKNSKNYGEFQQGNILPLHYLFEQCGVNRDEFFIQMKKNVKLTFKASHNRLFAFPDKNNNSQVIHQSSPTQSSPNNVNRNKAKHFQIFGYDFMLDQNKHMWLIQVNTNPCIQLSNPWLKLILPRMLDDAFKLTIDCIFPKGKQIKLIQSNIKKRPTKQQQNRMNNINLIPTEALNFQQCTIETQKSPNKKNQRPFKAHYSVPGYQDTVNMWQKLDLTQNTETLALTSRQYFRSKQI